MVPAPQTQPAVQVDAETRQQIVESTAHTLRDYYVFPDQAQQMHDKLLAALAAHNYDDLTSAETLCEKLTAELQAICHDKHVRVRYNEDPRPVTIDIASHDVSPEELEMWIDMARRVNFGFYKVERLNGNIGYIDLRNFWEVGWEGAAEAAVGAMNLLAHTDALIFDMRQNGGGSPTMVAFLISFLVSPDPVHLNSFYERPGDTTRQSWSMPYVPGRRTPDKPVYVLTSNRTFSGAEEFTYNLKNMKRATIIGETTGGGAHPGRDVSVTPHFRVFVPMGRAINPISGTNWEGTGVEPDIAVPQEAALNEAYRLALGDVLKKLENQTSEAARNQKKEVQAALTELEK
ncbi:MAG TPA: S41 family peptidase [Phototrophicaceae bacterium]|jgi:C-terminal processing protease CtpA/Prc|nr:S41 family peptidase [Phototrophicaceae bacterium]